ncbi:endonuclease/exonuclease/phosphatase family protein [Ciceribacter sp. L1K22]|uniref:endonuclease/exonuclease/phosphatase family protein n=1 Tax=Ciceribacter sp. L1K22 TaxID=2820275 RepID=UPI001ABE2409|nr:endonuclease/exonuclease/phosphatase family protein [Ciceribacter sp. L1K22]MBO3761026.1 endonuclease/exonuclease/phosphatase family protein [Ciceribacter sp. L1K22]
MKTSLASAVCTIVTLAIVAMSLRYLTDFWPLSFIYTLQSHAGIAAMSGALVAIMLGARRYGTTLLLAAAALTVHSVWMSREFLPAARDVAAGAPTVRLMSFNILSSNHANAGRIADEILSSEADIVYLFEAAPTLSQLSALSEKYPYRIGCGEVTRGCDLMVLSRLPMKKRGAWGLSDLRGERFAVAEIDVGGRTVHFAAIHLTKPYYDDYHSTELEVAGTYFARHPGTWVVAGDFNSGVIAPDMQHFLRTFDMTTAGTEPATWPVAAGRWGVALDHVFVSPDVAPLNLERMEDNYGSNHFGLIADLAFPAE